MYALFVYETNSQGEFFLFPDVKQLEPFKKLYELTGKKTEVKKL